VTARTPPRFVPTLTEVVHTAPVSPAADAPGLPPLSQEQLAQRVLQRVDLMLDRRLRETLATVIVEQTNALAPLLRERLQAVVREIVADAVAEEMRARQRSGDSSV